jgi:hypothetical protein
MENKNEKNDNTSVYIINNVSKIFFLNQKSSVTTEK